MLLLLLLCVVVVVVVVIVVVCLFVCLFVVSGSAASALSVVKNPVVSVRAEAPL